MALLARRVWVTQFEDLHNTTATSEKVTGRVAACQERFKSLITSQDSSDNPRADYGAANG